jgi:hypothetical protein
VQHPDEFPHPEFHARYGRNVGEPPSAFALAVQKRLDEYQKPHGNAWWLWTVVKNRAYSVWIDVVKPIFLRRYLADRLFCNQEGAAEPRIMAPPS